MAQLTSDVPTEQETTEFLEIQFFLFLIPCYYGFVALLVRYHSLSPIDPIYYLPHVPLKGILRCLDPDPSTARNSLELAYRVPPASYLIKSKLSLLNCYLYLAMIVLTYIVSPSLFYSASYPFESPLYLFGAAAWYLSAAVLRKEHQRGIHQSLWSLRMFWILAGTFSLYKLFVDYFRPINLILNCFFIPTNLLLALYGLYRPTDNETLDLATSNDHTPAFVKSAFATIELNERVRQIFRVQDQPNPHLQFAEGDMTPVVREEDYQVIGQAFKHSAEAIRTEINLLQELPRRNVFVDRKVYYIKDGDRQKACYAILSQIGYNRFEAFRTVTELEKIYSSLKQLFSHENFPRLSLPILKVTGNEPIVENSDEASAWDPRSRAEAIQHWIEQLFATPIFLVAQVLEFLEIEGEHAAPFLTYHESSYHLFCSKHYLVMMQAKQRERKRSTVVNNFNQMTANYQTTAVATKNDHEQLMDLLQHSFQFTVQGEDEGDPTKYNFTVNCLVNNRTRFNWSLAKSQDQMQNINQIIEEQCNRSVPFYYHLTLHHHKKHQAQLEAYRTYIQKLLDDTRFYCTSLFFFIRFDPIRLQINTSGSRMSFQGMNTNRQSRFLSEYEDRGAFIEVTRVDRVGDVFKFRVRRDKLQLKEKNSDEILELRDRLEALYKGVSVVPELQFDDKCSKNQAKRKIEWFLSRIQNLPKISINRDYLTFYDNAIKTNPSQ